MLALEALVVYIYALLGMTFFGEMDLNTGPYQLYNEHANFRTFPVACLTLFRFTTGESWNGIMHDCMEYNEWAWVYFVSFMMLAAYMVLNLLIAIVLDQFQRVMTQVGVV